MNLPNSITMSRICCIPLLIWMLSAVFPFRSIHGEQEIAASLLFILASITDGVDGYLARKRGQITTMGMLLDPLADKLMITAAYVCLVQFNPHLMKAWMAVLVIGREFLVSGLRSIASSEGFTIEASDLAKLKTVIQIVSVVAVILAHGWYCVAFRLVHPAGGVDRDRRHLLHGAGLDHFRSRLLCRLLAQDRPRLGRPPFSGQLCAEPQKDMPAANKVS